MRRKAAIHMRRVKASDCMDLFAWRNDPETRKNSVSNTARVPLADHRAWFAAKMKDPHTRLYIGISGRRKVGLMRFDIEGDHAVVTTHVNPACRGMGVGTRIMALTTRKTFDEFRKPIVAKIRTDNIASIRMCAKNGYRITTRKKDITYMRYDGSAGRT